VLIGPSGCGKSTLLKLLLGLVAPSSGEVYYQDKPLGSGSLLELRRRVGYVVQSGGLFPHLSARRNIALMASFLGWGDRAIDHRLEFLIELTQFPRDALDRYPGELSGGQSQRVSLMRALMLDPEALLLDEPLGALDPMIRYDLQEDLGRIFDSLGKTVVLVTHDLAEAEFFGGRVVLLKDGTIVQQGPLQALVDQPADEFVVKFTRAQRSHVAPGSTRS
jgi:osmoprotectant transport system ATP-binding protein